MARLTTHDPSLDGLRGLAIVAVVCYHARIAVTAAAPIADRALAGAVGLGWAGVDLFFVLSGYLITGILLDTKGGAGFFRSFYARRALRIFPLYYAALGVVLLLVPPIAAPWITDPARWTAGAPWLLTYLTNWHIASAGTTDVVAPLTLPYWSLAVEEQFYLVWPLVVLACSRRALAWVALALIVAALAARLALEPTVNGYALYMMTFTRLDTLAVGAAIAIAERSPGGLDRLARYATPAMLTAALVVAGIVVAQRSPSHFLPLMETIGFTALAVGFGAFLVVARTRAPRVLTVRWLRRLGERSYGVYIWHTLPLYAVTAVGLPAHVPVIGGSSAPRQLVAALVVIALAWAVAEVSWYVLEEPCLRLKRLVPRPVPGRHHRVPPAAALAARPEH